MKKYFTSAKHKRRNSIRSKSAVDRQRKRKNKKYVPGRNFSTSIHAKPKQIINLTAPNNFSFIENTDETIEYFRNAHKELKSGNAINFDISKITSLTTDAIAVQIAKIRDHRFHFSRGIIGNEPSDASLSKLFQQSGFYEHVKPTRFTPERSDNLLVHKITQNKVEPKLAKEACLIGLKHTFGNEEIFEPLYDILIEIMQNTNNHAGEKKGKYDWWLLVYKHPETKVTSYTFLDLGVGIFESLPVQTFKRTILEFINLASNIDLVEKLFRGEIKSRTSRPERGKGIPQVYECSQDVAFSKFILISNDIFADLKTNSWRLLKSPFDGTMFYWELTNKNENNGN